MALDSRTLAAACNGVQEQSNDGGDANMIDGVPPPTTAGSGDGVEAPPPPPPVYKKGAWSKEEDDKLKRAVEEYGVRNWVTIEKFSGLARPAKNCRLRWLNYLRPNLKKYPFTPEEERLILHLHSKYGNSWSRIASKLPGRSDNEIKNFWHKRAKKCQKHHLPLYPTSKDKKHQTHSSNNNDQTNNEYFPNYHNPQTLISFSNPTNHLTDQTTSQMQNLLVSSPHMLDLPFWQGDQPSSNAFTPPQQVRFSRPMTTKLSPIVHSQSVANFQMPWSSSSQIASPTSPMKMKSSPSTPALYTVQMGPQATESPMPLVSGFQLGSSSNVAQVKTHMSNTVPLETCFQSNISLPESTIQMNPSGGEVPPSSSSQPNLSTCNQDLPLTHPMIVDSKSSNLDFPTIQPMENDSDHAKGEHPSIQLNPPKTPEIDSCVRKAEFDSHLQIMVELREALARVRFLRRKLKQKRFSTNSRTKHSLGDILRVNAPTKKARAINMLKRILGRKHEFTRTLKIGALQLKNAEHVKKSCKLQKRKNPEDGEYTQEGIESKKARCENSETRIVLEESLQRQEAGTSETKIVSDESLQRREASLSDETFKRNNSMSFQEESHSIDVFAHLDNQNPVAAPNSNSWDNKLCSFEGLFSESSTLLQDSFLKGDLFGQSSGIEDPLSSQNAFGPVYSQSTLTDLVKPGDEGRQIGYHEPNEGGFFSDSFGQEFSNSMERNFTEDIRCDSNLLPHQYSRTELQNSSYTEGEKFSVQTSARENSVESSKLCESSLLMQQYPGTEHLNSSYLKSKQIMEQEFPGGEQFIRTSTSGNSTLLMHPCHSDDLIDSSYLVDFEHEYNRGEEYSIQRVQRTVGSSLVQNIWPEGQMVSQNQRENTWREGQMVSQDQTHSQNGFHTSIDPNATTHSTKSRNWNDEPGFSLAVVHNRDQQNDHTNISEELASLLEFFPTTIHTLEWYNYCNAVPSVEASADFETSLGFHMPSTPHPLISTADYT